MELERTDKSPQELEGQMFLAHDQLLRLEDEVWLDYQEQADRGFLSQEEAQNQYIKWRNNYLDVSNPDALPLV